MLNNGGVRGRAHLAQRHDPAALFSQTPDPMGSVVPTPKKRACVRVRETPDADAWVQTRFEWCEWRAGLRSWHSLGSAQCDSREHTNKRAVRTYVGMARV